MDLNCGGLDIRHLIVAQASGYKVFALIGCIACLVIVVTVIGRDLDRRQSDGSFVKIHNRNGDIATFNETLKHDMFLIGESIDHGGAKITGILSTRHSKSRTARRRLYDKRESQRGVDHPKNIVRAELAEQKLGKGNPPGGIKSGCANERLSRRLVGSQHRLRRC